MSASKNALSGLADEGVAVRIRGKGTFVASTRTTIGMKGSLSS
ncbi:hypothetical protein ACX1C1_09860 [Paenibacillus sp. strain BS8-2]